VLIAVHQALLVMAAARGDQVAILSLPYSFRQSEAIAYQASLLNSPAVTNDPLPTLPSYGALYHPWIVTPDTVSLPPQSLRSLVPDGAVCGVIAATTLSSGAWIAPANVAVTNAVALVPPLQSGTPLAFASAQINLIAQQHEGFMITAQDTLVSDQYADLQPLNVRRLLILLRRLALREGIRYVFQNNSPTFQRTVTRQFQQWMQLLLAKGAFAGSSAQDSYQVITDASVNTQSSIDQGRFVVKLLVAPSVPMQFLTVLLVQSGGQLSLVGS
jgi:phage tail sheath protein FI